MSKSGYFLVIGAGEIQIPLIQRLKEREYKVFAIDGDCNAPGLLVADRSLVIDIKDIELCINSVSEYNIIAVATLSSDIALPAVAAVAASKGLLGPDLEAVKCVTNKKNLNKRLSDENIPVARSVSVSSIVKATDVYKSLGDRVVIKPPDSAGSRGVSYVDKLENIEIAFHNAQKISGTGYVLVESFLDGLEVSVEGFVIRGEYVPLCISDKMRTAPPYLLDRKVSFPANCPSDLKDRIFLIAKQAIKATGIDNCPFHMELMLTDDGPYVVEIAGRGAGFHVFSKILPWVTSVETVDTLIDLSLGRNVSVECGPLRGAVIHFIEAEAGEVVSITGLDDVRKMQGVFDVDIYPKLGDIVVPLTSGSDRLGYLITMAGTRHEAESVLDNALDCLTIKTKPLS